MQYESFMHRIYIRTWYAISAMDTTIAFTDENTKGGTTQPTRSTAQ